MLTRHFSIEEFTVSNTGARMGIDNTPDATVTANLLRTAQLMERIRELLGSAILITSGYRCAELNKAIGGAVNSAHMQGLAADFIAPGFGSPLKICQLIEGYMDDFGIDQLIHEHTWVHVGLREEAPRHQVLTLLPHGGYTVGIKA